MEEAHSSQLLKFFGGFYEVAVFNGERFTKDLGVTYVLWAGKELDSQGFATPNHIITTTYLDDVLVLRSQKLIPTGGGQFQMGEVQVHVVDPIYGRSGPSVSATPATVAQETPWRCHCLLAQKPDGRIRQLAFVERPKYDGSDNFSIDTRDGIVLKVNWKKQFWIDLHSAINAP